MTYKCLVQHISPPGMCVCVCVWKGGGGGYCVHLHRGACKQKHTPAADDMQDIFLVPGSSCLETTPTCLSVMLPLSVLSNLS